MASPDDPEATADAAAAGTRPPLASDSVELPVYRPRRRVAARFWLAFVLAAVIAAAVLWFVLV